MHHGWSWFLLVKIKLAHPTIFEQHFMSCLLNLILSNPFIRKNEFVWK